PRPAGAPNHGPGALDRCDASRRARARRGSGTRPGASRSGQADGGRSSSGDRRNDRNRGCVEGGAVSEFQGKVVLVTGGTRGIGRACAELFAQHGASVAVCGRNADTAAAAAAEIGPGVRGYGADMADPAAVDGLLKAVAADLGPVTILVNNAGLTRDGLLMRMKDDDWNA